MSQVFRAPASELPGRPLGVGLKLLFGKVMEVEGERGDLLSSS